MTRGDLEQTLRTIEQESGAWRYVAKAMLGPSLGDTELANLLEKSGNPRLPVDYLQFLTVANGLKLDLFKANDAHSDRSNPDFTFQVFGLPDIVFSTIEFLREEDRFISISAGPDMHAIPEPERIVYESSFLISDFEGPVLIYESASADTRSGIYYLDNNYLFEDGWLTHAADSLEEHLSRSFAEIVAEEGATWGFYQ